MEGASGSREPDAVWVGLRPTQTVKQWQFAKFTDENDYKPMRGFGVLILERGNVKHFIKIVCLGSLLGDQNHHAVSE
jgi:hypothetical protein